MNAVDIAFPRLKVDEGFRAHAYKDTYGYETIGYGFNIAAGISERAAGALLMEQLLELHEQLSKYNWYAIDPVRQSVLLNIALNEGLGGLLKFPHMLSAIGRQDWVTAAEECKVSDPKLDASRYAPLRQILLTGGVP